jgi:hypothetical protein
MIILTRFPISDPRIVETCCHKDIWILLSLYVIIRTILEHVIIKFFVVRIAPFLPAIIING